MADVMQIPRCFEDQPLAFPEPMQSTQPVEELQGEFGHVGDVKGLRLHLSHQGQNFFKRSVHRACWRAIWRRKTDRCFSARLSHWRSWARASRNTFSGDPSRLSEVKSPRTSEQFSISPKAS